LTLVLVALAGWILAPAARAPEPPVVRYLLRAALNDNDGRVIGAAEIRYRHLGPDTLRSLTLHLEYNGFRPGARGWPAQQVADSGSTGFEHIFNLRVDGAPATLEWPGTPDSSAALLRLIRPLAPGDSLVITLEWNARPPALKWRLDRRGRRLELVGWYPEVMDQTSGTTVPFPAYATFLLQLDLAADQVIGGTGVPLCGDPGWAGAAASPSTRLTLQRDWYRTPQDPRAAAATCDGAGRGMKRMKWYAEGVTQVAFVLSPTFRYEEGDFDALTVHTLYERGGEQVWGAGLATRRAETAAAWILDLGGHNPWPHLTVAQGLDRTGHALPMVLLSEVPSQAALLELLGLMNTQQVMAGGAPVFTVGTAAYQAAWFFEAIGRRGDYERIEREILEWDLDRLALRPEPLQRASSTSPCASTICRRTEFMSYQLRRWAGSDEAIRKLYRALYTRFQLRPTLSGAFQQMARELIQPNPDSLYAQLPRGGTLYDDAVTSVRREQVDSGRWRTTAVVERRAAGVFPRILWVIADSDTVVARATALTRRETLTVVTRTPPRRAVLDPLAESHDWNMLNNQRGFGIRPGWLLLAPHRPTHSYLDTYFSRQTARDRLTMGWAPTAWYNDVGGWTFGARLREDYLARFELNQLWVSVSSGREAEGDRIDINGRLLLKNPVGLRAPGRSEELLLSREEGRAAVRIEVAQRFRSRVADSTWRSLGVALQWLTVTDPAYVDSGYYDDAGTVELTVTGRLARPGRPWPFQLEAGMVAGYGYANGGAGSAGGYGRFTLATSTRIPAGKALSIGARVYAGATLSADSVPRQRRVYLAGADPYRRFDSPFLRSRGSLLAGSGFFYQSPGGAGVRGLDPRLSGDRALGATVELEYTLTRHPTAGLFNRIALAAFGDAALARGDLDPGAGRVRAVGDAGVGVRVSHRVGQTRFMTRLDLPFWVSRPSLAQDDRPDGAIGFRWGVSFAPAF
jgi:hypothetical protein